MNPPPRKNCIICEMEIFRGKSPNRETRTDNAVACSPKCSKTYMRVVNSVSTRIRRSFEKKVNQELK